jgi:hypothetical protein
VRLSTMRNVFADRNHDAGQASLRPLGINPEGGSRRRVGMASRFLWGALPHYSVVARSRVGTIERARIREVSESKMESSFQA